METMATQPSEAAVRLRDLSVGDGLAAPVDKPAKPALPTGLDETTEALVRLAASIAIGGSEVSNRRNIVAALSAGASVHDVIGTLIAVGPTVGLARLISAVPSLAEAVGYDIDAALERFDL